MPNKIIVEDIIDEMIDSIDYIKLNTYIELYLILILYVILMMANTYRISKIDKGIKGREILEKNDKILFKDEKNVR